MRLEVDRAIYTTSFDECSILRLQIFEQEPILLAGQPTVVAGGLSVADDDVAVRPAAYDHTATLGHLREQRGPVGTNRDLHLGWRCFFAFGHGSYFSDFSDIGKTTAGLFLPL